MIGPEVNLARAELWARTELGEGGRFLLDATIDGRAVTEAEQAELRAAVSADLLAADVLRRARIAGLDAHVVATEELLALLGPWWPDGLSLGEVLGLVPAGTRDEAAVLLQLTNATAGQ